MSKPSRSRRAYDSPARREQAARTRNRIIAAGSELVHEYTSWDWQELTFRAVAARAGVGERTVYRHFPTERELRDAVMRRLEDEAQISYADVDLANLTEVTGRFFAALQRFTVDPPAQVVDDPAFEGADRRRRDAVLRAVTESAPDWPAHRQRAVAGLLDVLWNPPSYERLIRSWQLPPSTAADSLTWLMELVIASVRADGAGAAPT